MPGINFFTEDVRVIFSERIKIRSWIKSAIVQENFKLGDLNIVFCSDYFLHNLNERYLNHDSFTDIITFPFENSGDKISGDIFISIDRVAENAIKYNQLQNVELRRVIIHGVLHLCGYPDKTRKQKEVMRAKEDNYLEKF